MKKKMHNLRTSLVILTLKNEGQINKFKTILYFQSKCYAMNLCRFMLFDILFKLKMKHVMSHFDPH